MNRGANEARAGYIYKEIKENSYFKEYELGRRKLVS